MKMNLVRLIELFFVRVVMRFARESVNGRLANENL